MKSEKIVKFIKEAGFELVNNGTGFGIMEGYSSFLYQKRLDGACTQRIRLGVVESNRDDIRLTFENVPIVVRDKVYEIMNDYANDKKESRGEENSMQIGF